MSPATVQLNTRISADLKEQGDQALARAGYTPSQAVRALWEFATRHAHEPSAVHAILEDEDTAKDAADEAQARLGAFEEGLHIVDDAYKTLGISPHDAREFEHLDYKVLRDMYYEECLEQGE